jgi:hypothetical protein
MDCAQDDVLQFAHVPRPTVLKKQRLRIGCELAGAPASRLVLDKEVVGEQRDVFTALA